MEQAPEGCFRILEGKGVGWGGHARKKEQFEQKCGCLKAEGDLGQWLRSGQRVPGGPPAEIVRDRSVAHRCSGLASTLGCLARN